MCHPVKGSRHHAWCIKGALAADSIIFLTDLRSDYGIEGPHEVVLEFVLRLRYSEVTVHAYDFCIECGMNMRNT